MTQLQRKAVARHRRRQKARGIVRLELSVRADDAVLLRRVARVLADPSQGDRARAVLRTQTGGAKPPGLKALLAAAPLDGVDLTRDHDLGRDSEL